MGVVPGHASRPPRSLAWWWLVPLVLVVGWLAALGGDALHLRDDAALLRQHAAAAKVAVEDRDIAALAVEVSALGDASDSFSQHSSGPHWWLAAHIPWLSDQVGPLRAAGDAVAGLTEGALRPLAELDGLEGLSSPEFVDGRIDPLILEPYRPTLLAAADAVHAEQDALDQVDLSGTISQVVGSFEDLRADVESVGEILDNAGALAELLPSMLGADGQRTYVVILQNNAEPRATGGIPGAVIEVAVTDGRLQLGQYYSAADLNVPDVPVAPLRDDELALFSENMALYVQNATYTPEFARTGELVAAYVERATGRRIDGVISIDPVALGYMLEGTPAREVSGVTISGDNFADVMLRDAYSIFPNPADQDEFFAVASAALFGDVVSGGDSTVAGAQRALTEGRFAVWSDDAAEQAILETTRAGGDFLSRTSTAGVFLNDGSGSKIGYYAQTEVEGSLRVCAASGETIDGVLTVTVSHTYDGLVEDLPAYVSGGGVYVAPGRFEANLVVYPPAGMSVSKLTANGEAAGLRALQHGARLATSTRVALEPGQTVTLRYELIPVEAGSQWEGIVITPGATPQVHLGTVEEHSEAC